MFVVGVDHYYFVAICLFALFVFYFYKFLVTISINFSSLKMDIVIVSVCCTRNIFYFSIVEFWSMLSYILQWHEKRVIPIMKCFASMMNSIFIGEFVAVWPFSLYHQTNCQTPNIQWIEHKTELLSFLNFIIFCFFLEFNPRQIVYLFHF